MLIPNDTLVLVGDGRKALFLRNTGGAGHPELFTETGDGAEQPRHPRPGDGPTRAATPDPMACQRAPWRRLTCTSRLKIASPPRLQTLCTGNPTIQDFRHLIVDRSAPYARHDANRLPEGSCAESHGGDTRKT